MAEYTEIPLSLWNVDKMPVDGKFIVQNLQEAQAIAYDGYFCYVKDLKDFIFFVDNNGTLEQRQIHLVEDITDQSYPASQITESTIRRFVSDTEKADWNSKAPGNHSHFSATTLVGGFMSAADKEKLDGIDDNANNYNHPDKHPATIIEETSEKRFVSDTEKADWNNKLSTGDYGLGSEALPLAPNNNFSSIVKSGSYRYNTTTVDSPDEGSWGTVIHLAYNATLKAQLAVRVGATGLKFRKTDAEGVWGDWIRTFTTDNLKAATQSTDGLMSAVDKQKFDNIEANANKYVHPTNHPASIIEESSTRRFVSDIEKANLADKYTKGEINNKLTALIEQIEFKEAVNTFNDLLTTYPTPQVGWTVYIKTLGQRYTWNNAEWVQSSGGEIPLSTSETDGLMAKTDKQKLDGVATNANNYIHPDVHPASIIEESTVRRFVSDNDKAKWNSMSDGLHEHETASSDKAGFMSASDKQKVDGVDENANNYTHPNNHPASIIEEAPEKRFVSDTEKTDWNNKIGSAVLSTDFNAIAVTGFYYNDSTLAVGIPAPTYYLVQHYQRTEGYAVQIAERYGSTQLLMRRQNNGTWYDWVEVFHTGNLTEVTPETMGLMSVSDKQKLDGVATNANNYSHPATHPASIIEESSTKRFFTDTERNKLSGVEANANNYAHPTTHPASIIEESSTKRFFTDEERTKLGDIAANANNYSHPTTHPASIIEESTTKRFVSDTEKGQWGSVYSFLASPREFTIARDITEPSPLITQVTPFDFELQEILNQFEACVIDDITGEIKYYLDLTDINKKRNNGTAANITGTDGSVMIIKPAFWVRGWEEGNVRKYKFSTRPFDGARYSPRFAIGKYKGFRNADGRLVSWSDANITTNRHIVEFMTDARLGRANMFAIVPYHIYRDIVLLYKAALKNLDSQTALGYVSRATSADWSAYNSYNPVWQTGQMNSLKTLYTGNKAITINNFIDGVNPLDTEMVSFLGIEDIFGHIWEFLTGLNINYTNLVGTAYICEDYNSLAPNTNINHIEVGQTPSSNGYVKQTHLGELIPSTNSDASSSTYYCDYHYVPASDSWRVALCGGRLHLGANCGLFYLSFSYSSSYRNASIGARLGLYLE